MDPWQTVMRETEAIFKRLIKKEFDKKDIITLANQLKNLAENSGEVE